MTTCPLVYVDGQVWELIELAELYRHGLPPVLGGSLDQAQAFTDACRFVWREKDRWRNEQGLIGETD